MRTAFIAFAFTALATPSLALTISPAPSRDALPHLKPQPPQQGVDLRDSYRGGGGGPAGMSYGQDSRSNTDAPRFFYNSYDRFGRFNGVIQGDDRLGTPRDRQTSPDLDRLQRRW